MFPIPRIHDLLDKLGKARVFSAVDLSSAYHQVRIKERIGKTAYRLDLTGGGNRQALRGIHDVFHVGLLRPYRDNGMQAQAPPVVIDESEEYEVERILQHRELRGKTQYLIRWKGYDQSEDMWLDEQDLGNAPDLLRDYRA